jgi:uncharacterized membrane-anchored protein YitT (DUF2179 family)
MKVAYVIAALIFALGIGLLIFGTSGSEDVTLLGLTFHPRIAKGVGIIAMIFSVITFMAAWGSSQTPSHSGRRG